MGRTDTLWSVNTLVRKVTCWNGACDKRLHRLISYLRHTQNWTQTCYVGDYPDDYILVCFCDASFAGDLEDSKSTSGAYVVLMGPRTFVPITWLCKKQGAVSHSSTEAEVIALDAAMRMECLPLWCYGSLYSRYLVAERKLTAIMDRLRDSLSHRKTFLKQLGSQNFQISGTWRSTWTMYRHCFQ